MPKNSGRPAPKPDRARLARSEIRHGRAERNFRIFNMLKAGVSVAQIAKQEGLSTRRLRELIQELLDRREFDPAPGFVQVQIGRLSDAMMIAHGAMMDGKLHALDRVVRLVGELDRYHGFGRLGMNRAPPSWAAEAGPRALPRPVETAEIDITKP